MSIPLPAPLKPGSIAVITGGASGIGLAAAHFLVERGVRVAIADLAGDRLDAATERLAKAAPGGAADVLGHATDVSRLDQVEALREVVTSRFGSVTLLMNNAGIRSTAAKPWEDPLEWRRVADTNLWGVVNGVCTFVPGMIASGDPGIVINTGSKQGITNPPGRPAYNLTKAALNNYTESLAHELLAVAERRISAHLLVPGLVWTAISGNTGEKPASAWTPEQTTDFLFEKVAAGDFYILCPDNEVDRPTDEARIRWSADDMIRNRPALSRWHPDHSAAFAKYMTEELEKRN